MQRTQICHNYTPSEPSDEEDIPDLVSLSEDEIEKDYVQLPFGSYLSPEQFNTELDK